MVSSQIYHDVLAVLQLGLDMAGKDQQTPEGLAAFNKGEIDKWWPIMKAAGIKPE